MEAQGYILDGMARALYVHAYMEWTEAAVPEPVLPPGKVTWEEVTPNTVETRTASEAAASQVATGIARENGLPVRGGLGRRFLEADNRHWDADPHSATWADRAYAFGRDLAMVCVGAMEQESVPAAHGLRLPSIHIELDDDGRVLSWDGGF